MLPSTSKVGENMKLIVISAIWCPACLIMRPIVDKAIENTRYQKQEYDYDLEGDAINQYNVGHVLPVLILCDDSKEIKRLIGEHTLKEVKTWLDS